MRSIALSRSFFGRICISFIRAVLLVGTMLTPFEMAAQQTGTSKPLSSPPQSPPMAMHMGRATSLRELVQEAA
jgi:hypothetical protein